MVLYAQLLVLLLIGRRFLVANFQYTADIMSYILFKAGEKTDGTSDFDAKALEYINSAYRKIWTGGGEFDVDINEDWTWLRSRSTFTLQTKITTGTVSVTNNSTTATLSATQATDVDNYYFKVDGHEDVFRISSHTGGSDTLTLDSVYTGDTDTAASYTLFKLDYTLASDAIEILSPMRVNRTNGNDGKVNGVSLNRLPPLQNVVGGVPNRFAYVDDTTIMFNKYAEDELIRVSYWYKKRPADLTDSGSEEPEVPLRHRHVIGNIALFDLLTDMNDDRAETYGLAAKQGLLAMSRENQSRISMMDGTFGAVLPRWDLLSTSNYEQEPYQS